MTISFIEREKGGERAVLVQMRVFQAEHFYDFDEALLEFSDLAHSAAVQVLETVTGKLTKRYPKYFVGEGKAKEIAELIKAVDAEVVFINHELTPGQGRNLEKLFQCRVLDRAELILDIFSQRARTFEGKLQVELAQLEHLRTRLIRGWTHLERQKGGIGLRGPGETQLETDRRLVDGRIKTIKRRLDKVAVQRAQNRRSRDRSDVPLISLVGYTNAGKSTLFNCLSESAVYVADKLFATLDPTLRYINLPQIGQAALADTVGFVRHLPHELIAAFKATLEETRQADLLIHVVDAHSAKRSDIMKDVDLVLEEIGAVDMPRLIVMNKIDAMDGVEPRIDFDEKGLPKRVWLSATKQNGLDLFIDAVVALLTRRIIHCDVTLKASEGRLRAKLYALGVVQSEEVDDDGNCLVNLAIQKQDFDRLFS